CALMKLLAIVSNVIFRHLTPHPPTLALAGAPAQDPKDVAGRTGRRRLSPGVLISAEAVKHQP
ncbi:MAG: hypothetical protein RL033_7177, partial [Pseudomonadota bacterium]